MDLQHLRQAFRDRFGHEPSHYAAAPGRVNLIGEHTDYNDGFVLPAAINRYVYLVAAPTSGVTCRLYSETLDEEATFSMARLAPGYPTGFARYAAGIAWALEGAVGRRLTALDVLVSSDLPLEAGVSSSAAFEVAFATLWNTVDSLGLSPIRLAQLAQQSENEYVGLNCGIMDQLASACGKHGHCLLVDTRSLEVRPVRIPPDLAIVVCDTGKARGLTESAYNERWQQCREAAAALGVPALRDADEGLLERHKVSMGDVVYRRARHVITENERVGRFVEALECSDRARVGMLMAASHASLRDDYEVSCPELDAMVAAAKVAPGCVGVRMTGAGFGGCCVALVDQNATEPFVETTQTGYSSRFNLQAKFLVCGASEGAKAQTLHDE